VEIVNKPGQRQVSIVETVQELLGDGKKKEVKTETVILMPVRDKDRPESEVSSRGVNKDMLSDIPTGIHH